MITNAAQLNAALHQLSSFADMLDALRLDADARQDYSLFPLASQGYLHRIREINQEIRAYLSDTNADMEAVNREPAPPVAASN